MSQRSHCIGEVRSLRTLRHNHGAGLTAPSDHRGLSVFFNATYADRRTSTQDNQLAAGLLYKGPFASAPRMNWALPSAALT